MFAVCKIEFNEGILLFFRGAEILYNIVAISGTIKKTIT
jgi:hypothetical protein